MPPVAALVSFRFLPPFRKQISRREREAEIPAAMAETLALAPVEDPEAPLDAAAIRRYYLLAAPSALSSAPSIHLPTPFVRSAGSSSSPRCAEGTRRSRWMLRRRRTSCAPGARWVSAASCQQPGVRCSARFLIQPTRQVNIFVSAVLFPGGYAGGGCVGLQRC